MADKFTEKRDPRSKDRGTDLLSTRHLKWLAPIGALVAIAMAWASMQGQTDASAGDIEENKAAIEVNAEKITDVRERVIVIGNEQNHMRADIKEMGEDIKAILRAVVTELHADKDFDE